MDLFRLVFRFFWNLPTESLVEKNSKETENALLKI